MKKTKILACLIFLSILSFISCRTTNNISSIQVEMMRPALFALPAEIDTIAIFKRDIFQSDTIIYKIINVDDHTVKTDSSIFYSELSNKCVDALANTLVNEGFFLKVINYSDSMNDLFYENRIINYPELHKKFGADAFVFLDKFKFRDRFSTDKNEFTDFMFYIKDKFPELHKSTKVEIIDADLLWTMIFKGDTIKYIKQPDNLYYGNSVYPELFGYDFQHKLLLSNAAEYLGKSFSKKIIPYRDNVDRNYYRSNNDQMLKAEKFLLENDWLKAAEIYKRETKNKNQNIAAKATYNMALICEMEGKLDAAIDWLNRSKSAFKHEDPTHTYNCCQYNALLEKRKKEIELLGKQIRNDESN